MSRSGKIILLSIVFLLIAAPVALARSQPQGPAQARQHAEGRENVLVGRVSLVEGELLRYVPAQKDWVVATKDSPFGFEDALYSGESAKAEFLMPNSTWLRIGSNTQVQLIALKPDATEVDVAVGTARFIDQSSKAVIKATTPFGYVVAEPGSAFDLYVGDESVEVIGIRGHVEFIHDTDGSRYEVVPGSLSILADARQATASEGKVDAEWDDWNVSRDTMWSQSIQTKGESARYLPEGIREDAGTLDENGRWERVYYEGEYRQVWRPTVVDPGWEPYSVGRWVDYYDDYCWVPSEPFGYVTHHYGNWFWANNYWYWSPPVVTVGVGAPWWGIGFSWYPGRVGWLYGDSYVGWFPLLPWEPFYARHWWGPHSFVMRYPGAIHYDVGRYHFANRAVIVNQSALFRTNNLATARIAPANSVQIAGNLRGAPVLPGAAIPQANLNQRFNFTNAAPTARPGAVAVTRVMQNQTTAASARSVNGRAIQQQIATAPAGRLAAGTAVTAPRATSRLVSGGGAPALGAAGSSRQLKQSARAVQPGLGQIGAGPGTMGRGPAAIGSRTGAATGQAGIAGSHGTGTASGSLGRSHGSAGAVQQGTSIGRTGRGQAGMTQVPGSMGRAQGSVRESRSAGRGYRSTPGMEQRGSRTLQGGESSSRSRMNAQGLHSGGMQRGDLSRGEGRMSPGYRGAPSTGRMGPGGNSGIQRGYESGMRGPTSHGVPGGMQPGMHAPSGSHGGPPAMQHAPQGGPGGGARAPRQGVGPGAGAHAQHFRG